MSELKPCPLCGGECEYGHDRRKGWIACQETHCPYRAIGLHSDRAELIAAHNRRVLPDDVQAVLKDVLAQIDKRGWCDASFDSIDTRIRAILAEVK